MTALRRVGLALLVAMCLTSCGSDAGERTSAPTVPIEAEAAMPGAEHAVIVHLIAPDMDEVFALEDVLEQRIVSAHVGEYDGNDLAVDGSEAILYAYGADADALWAVMEPIVRAFSPKAGSYVIKRYGEAGDPSAREARIDL